MESQGVEAVSVRKSVKPVWWAPVALALVGVGVMIALALFLPDPVAYAQVSQPTPDAYQVSMQITPVDEDAIADTATAVFGAYQNVIWLVGGITLGFFILRRARRLLR